MKVEEIIEFIKTAEAEDIVMIREACKSVPERIDRKELTRDDIARLLEFFPKPCAEYKGQRYDTVGFTYVNYIKAITDALCKAFTTKVSARGFKVWKGSDMLSQSKAKEYQYAFHKLTDTIIELAEELGTRYNYPKGQPETPDSD